jgi:sugar phosphate isomerase/epimerase
MNMPIEGHCAMTTPTTSRRSFLTLAATAATTACLGAKSIAAETSAAANTHPLRLGGPIFNSSKDPEALALAHKAAGYRAAYCPSVNLSDNQRIRDVAAAFAKHDVILAEVGRWYNLMDADPEKRAKNLKLVTDGLALAEELGARCCVDIAGSYHKSAWYGPHPANLSKEFFDAAVENARKIVDAVKPKRAKFTYEVMGWAIPDTADSYLALLKAIDREAFGVHLDPCNAVNSPTKFYDNTVVLDELFDKLGPWIVSCHAKDVAWSTPVELQVHLVEVIPGHGSLDYVTYLKRLAALPRDVPLMLEHLKTKAEYEEGQRYIREVAGKSGVSIL